MGEAGGKSVGFSLRPGSLVGNSVPCCRPRPRSARFALRFPCRASAALFPTKEPDLRLLKSKMVEVCARLLSRNRLPQFATRVVIRATCNATLLCDKLQEHVARKTWPVRNGGWLQGIMRELAICRERIQGILNGEHRLHRYKREAISAS